MTSFIEQEGLLSSPTLADERGYTVRSRSEARQLRFHCTVIFQGSGEWAVEIANGPAPLTGLYVVRAEPDPGPASATARTFADPLSGLPTLSVEVSPYHPPCAMHLALLIEYSDDIFDAFASSDPPMLIYRLYPPPTMVMSPRTIALVDEAAVNRGRQSFSTWPWPKNSQMSIDQTLPPPAMDLSTSLPPLPIVAAS